MPSPHVYVITETAFNGGALFGVFTTSRLMLAALQAAHPKATIVYNTASDASFTVHLNNKTNDVLLGYSVSVNEPQLDLAYDAANVIGLDGAYSDPDYVGSDEYFADKARSGVLG